MARGSNKPGKQTLALEESKPAKDLVKSIQSDPVVMSQARDFIAKLGSYTAADYQFYENHKKVRGDMVKAFFKLPEFVQKAITTPDSELGDLLRGGDHAVRKDKSGMINASFSKNPKTALSFGEVVYTPADIESHGPVINVAKAVSLAGSLEKATGEQLARFQKDLAVEQEHIITNIKWKPEVDNDDGWWERQTKFKAELEDKVIPLWRNKKG